MKARTFVLCVFLIHGLIPPTESRADGCFFVHLEDAGTELTSSMTIDETGQRAFVYFDQVASKETLLIDLSLIHI